MKTKKSALPANLASVIENQRVAWREVNERKARLAELDFYLREQRTKLANLASDDGQNLAIADAAANFAKVAREQAEITGCIEVAESRRTKLVADLEEANTQAMALGRVTTGAALNRAREALLRHRTRLVAMSIANGVRERLIPLPYPIDSKFEGFIFEMAAFDISLAPFKQLPTFDADVAFGDESAFEASAAFLEKNAADVAAATEWFRAFNDEQVALASSPLRWKLGSDCIVLNLPKAA